MTPASAASAAAVPIASRRGSRRGLTVCLAVAAALLMLPLSVAQAGQRGSASTPDIATVDEFNVQNLMPSRIALDGGHPVLLTGHSYQSVCSFDVMRYSAYSGSWRDLGIQYSSQLRYVDYLPGYLLGYVTEYAIQAKDCSGNAGDWTYSIAFTPVAFDDTAANRSGTWQRVYNSAAYNGSYLRSSSGFGTSLTYYTNSIYNIAFYATTSRAGGKATLYVDGVARGAVNFASYGTKTRVLVAKTGWAFAGYHTIRLVTSGRGAYSGLQMSLDAIVENQS